MDQLFMILILLVVCAVGMAMVCLQHWARCASKARASEARASEARANNFRHGGAPRRGPDYTKSNHIVVDTLNLTHWLHEKSGGREPLILTPALIANTIDRTAPALLKRHPGRVMYVLKDRESQFNDEAAREVYRQAADQNRVHVMVVERYADPPKGVAVSTDHSSRGRDDFFIAMLAHRWRCAVLTEDRMRDFEHFRATIQPFHVYEFAFCYVHREFVRPESTAYARIKKPRMVRYDSYFPD
jgi:hypothetical protein